MLWEAIKYVTSGLTLVAFAIAVAAWLYTKSWRNKERLIRLAPETKRKELIGKTLEFFDIDTRRLTPERQYDLAKEQIERRAQRTKLIASSVGFLAFLIAVTAVVAIVKTPAKPEPAGGKEFTQISFGVDIRFVEVVENVEKLRNVTIVFDRSCDQSARNDWIVSKGDHSGNDIEEFLQNLKDRIKQTGIQYSVEKTGERRYEIRCP
jgi:hypothetical protein